MSFLAPLLTAFKGLPSRMGQGMQQSLADSPLIHPSQIGPQMQQAFTGLPQMQKPKELPSVPGGFTQYGPPLG